MTWAVAALVTALGLQVLGRMSDVFRRPVNPTARSVVPLPTPAFSGAFVGLELPGVLLMVAGLGLLVRDIGLSWVVSLYLVLLVAGRAPALLYRQLAEQSTRSFTPGPAVVGGRP